MQSIRNRIGLHLFVDITGFSMYVRVILTMTEVIVSVLIRMLIRDGVQKKVLDIFVKMLGRLIQRRKQFTSIRINI